MRSGSPTGCRGWIGPISTSAPRRSMPSPACLLHDREAAYLERVGLDWVEKVQTINQGRIIDPEVAAICETQQDPVAVTEYGGSGFAFPYLFHRVFGPGETPVHARGVPRRRPRECAIIRTRASCSISTTRARSA